MAEEVVFRLVRAKLGFATSFRPRGFFSPDVELKKMFFFFRLAPDLFSFSSRRRATLFFEVRGVLRCFV